MLKGLPTQIAFIALMSMLVAPAQAEQQASAADLELYAIDIDEDECLETTDWLEANDFDFDDGDLAALSSDLDYGWDEVSTDVGEDIMHQMEQILSQVPYEPDFEVQTFEDYGMDDFGDDFGGSDFDFDW